MWPFRPKNYNKRLKRIVRELADIAQQYGKNAYTWLDFVHGGKHHRRTIYRSYASVRALSIIAGRFAREMVQL